MPNLLLAELAALAALAAATAAPKSESPPTGNATIRASAGGSEIVITTTARLAGAVHSLTWGGKEFIDSTDHGRQLQSAASFDCARPGRFHAECYNPTEAGSRADHVGNRSRSRLLWLRADGAELHTLVRPAFWLAPGEKSEGLPALNTSELSDHLISKRVRIGADIAGRRRENVIAYDVGFTLPPGEVHKLAQFEVLTGYMPAEFSVFLRHDAAAGRLVELSDGPGEQADPVVLSTVDGRHAMGCLSLEAPRLPLGAGAAQGPGYGRFRFEREKVVKWNVVFRFRSSDAVSAGDYSFRVFVIVGSRAEVQRTLNELRPR